MTINHATPNSSALTIDEVLSELIARDLMQADHVDPDALETLMRSAAAFSGSRPADTVGQSHAKRDTSDVVALRRSKSLSSG